MERRRAVDDRRKARKDQEDRDAERNVNKRAGAVEKSAQTGQTKTRENGSQKSKRARERARPAAGKKQRRSGKAEEQNAQPTARAREKRTERAGTGGKPRRGEAEAREKRA